MPTPRNDSPGETLRSPVDYSNDALISAHLHHYREYSAATLREKDRRLRYLSEATGVPLIATTKEHLTAAADLITGGADNLAAAISVWKVFFHWLQYAGIRLDDPTIHLRRPKLRRRKPRPAPDGEVHLTLRGAAVTDPEVYVMLRWMRFSGVRCSDIERARVEWVRDEQGVTIVGLTGKGGVDRDVPLDPETARLTQRFLRGGRGHVFTRPSDGRPYREGAISDKLCRYIHAYGWHWTPHQIRHRAVTELYRVCQDPMVLARLMGWASIRTAENYAELDMSRSASFIAEVHARYQHDHGLTVVRGATAAQHGGHAMTMQAVDKFDGATSRAAR